MIQLPGYSNQVIHGTLLPSSSRLVESRSAANANCVANDSNIAAPAARRCALYRRCWSAGPVLVAALTISGGITSAPGTASPSVELSTCTFTLTAPQVSTLAGGVRAVIATLKATACEGSAAPARVTVCVEAPSGKSVCGEDRGWTAAQAVLPSAAPGGTYNATGVGCWDDPSTIVNTCTSSGPVSATI